MLLIITCVNNTNITNLVQISCVTESQSYLIRETKLHIYILFTGQLTIISAYMNL